MCGIVGTNSYKYDFLEVTKLLQNRGKDGINIYQYNQHHFGHTILSIVDINASQPMVFDDIVLVFNGEIYNYKELIKDENLKLKTQSDTEVIIRLYQKYQSNFIHKLNGAFAFCLYDKTKDLYLCAKDWYG